MRSVLLAILSFLVLAMPASADMPAPIAAAAQKQMDECRSVGGTPTLTAQYLTQVELNGDGQPDYIVDVAGLDCQGAASYFCGSAGCPLSVWLSSGGTLAEAWTGYAQAHKIKGKSIEIAVHGSFCNPPRVGIDICYKTLTFDKSAAAPPPAPAPAATTPQAPPPPSPLAWDLRVPPGGTPVAVVGGPGNLRSLAIFCLNGRPVLAAVLNQPPAANVISLGLTFSGGHGGGPAQRGPGTGAAYMMGLAGGALVSHIAGTDSVMPMAVDGVPQGDVSLRDSSRAIHAALATCLRF